MNESTLALERARSDGEMLTEFAGGKPHDAVIVLGSGYGGVGEALVAGADEASSMSIGELRYALAPTVSGHGGLMHSLKFGDSRVLVAVGRSHLYEGRSATEVVHLVRSAVLAGAKIVILTSAVGGIRSGFSPGTLVAVSDHLNLTGANPLIGLPTSGEVPTPFVSMTGAYSKRLLDLARSIDPDIESGVLATLLGPNYETPAEIQMLKAMGADLAGISIVIEAIATKHLGAEVFGLSLVTNLAAGIEADGSGPSSPTHEEVKAAGMEASERIGRLLVGMCRSLSQSN